MKRVSEPTNVADCPVCFEHMKAPIFLCEKGHSLCGKCTKSVNGTCPTCRAKMTTARNFTLESLVENSQDGSKAVIKIPDDTPVIPQIKCPTCTQLMDKSKVGVEKHFKDIHDEKVLFVFLQSTAVYKDCFSLLRAGSDSEPFSKDTKIRWRRTIALLENQQFLSLFAHAEDGLFFYQVKNLTGPTTARQIFFEKIQVTVVMPFKKQRNHIRGFNWKGFIEHHDSENPVIVLPYHQVKDLGFEVDFNLKFEK